MQYEKRTNTSESAHCEMDWVRRNTIQRTKCCSSTCAYNCAQLQYI